MNITLFVSNWPWSTTEVALRALFAEYGPVGKITVPLNREQGRPQGYAFVEMEREAGERAMQDLEGVDWGGRALRIREAEDRPKRHAGRFA